MPQSVEGSAARLVRNTLSSGGSRLANAVLALALTPILLRRLGPAEYGVWLLATTLTFTSGFLNLAELGLQQAAVRLVAEARQRNDDRSVSEVVSTVVALFMGMGLVLGVVVAAAAVPLTTLFSVPAGLEHAAVQVFALVGAQIALDMPAAGTLAYWDGSQRFGVSRGIDVGSRLAWTGATVVSVWLGHGVVGIGVVSVAIAALTLAAQLAALGRQPDVTLRLGLVTRASVHRLSGHGAPMFGLRILAVLYTQMDRAIIGVALGTVAVARYEVAYKLHAAAALALGVAPAAVLPTAAYLGQERMERLRALFVRGTKYAVAFGLPVAVAGTLYARPLIATWVGADYVDIADEARVFLLYPAVAIGLVVGQAMVMGVGRVRPVLLYHLCSVTVNLVVSLILVGRMGVGGVIWGTVAGYMVVLVPFHRLFFRSFAVGPADWLRRVVLPNLPGLGVQLAFGAATLAWAENLGQLWAVGLVALASWAASAATFVLVGLSPAERSGLMATVRRQRTPAPG